MSDSNVFDIDKMRSSASDASSLLKAMGHSERLLLLCQLSQKEMCVSDLAQQLAIGQPNLSQQLGVLRRQNLVSTRKEGKHVYYSIADDNALKILQTLYQLFCNNEGA